MYIKKTNNITNFLQLLLELLLAADSRIRNSIPFHYNHHQYAEIQPRPPHLEGNVNQMKLLYQHPPRLVC